MTTGDRPEVTEPTRAEVAAPALARGDVHRVAPAQFRLHLFRSEWIEPLVAMLQAPAVPSRGRRSPDFSAERRSEASLSYVLLAEAEAWLSTGAHNGYFAQAEGKPWTAMFDAPPGCDWLLEMIRPTDQDAESFMHALSEARDDLTANRAKLLRLLIFAEDDEWEPCFRQLADVPLRLDGPSPAALSPRFVDDVAWSLDGFGWNEDSEPPTSLTEWVPPGSEPPELPALTAHSPAAWRMASFDLVVERSPSVRDRLRALNEVRHNILRAIEQSAEAEDARRRAVGDGALTAASNQLWSQQRPPMPQISDEARRAISAASIDVAALTSAALTQPVALRPAVSMPSDFEFGEVRPLAAPPAAPAPELGPLAAFVGTFTGTGFNTIFRPDSTATPTPLPTPVGGDNVLELNITRETLSFSAPLGSVPNRGTATQADAFLNGVPYLQSISDITGGQKTGIHFEPGLWIHIPTTTAPAEGVTVARMASIPHGTTINAQGTFRTFPGGPRIPSVDITPTVFGTANKIRFASQTANAQGTPRIPQDLTAFINAGTITQAILDDPNTVLRDHNAGLTIVQTTVIDISTSPAAPLFAGGTDNIAFLVGNPAADSNPAAGGQNAQATQMSAIFWINVVEHTVLVPPFELGHPPLLLKPESTLPSELLPTFVVRPPVAIATPRPIKVRATHVQYSQVVNLVFAHLLWPHVSVASLVPSAPVEVPPSAWQ